MGVCKYIIIMYQFATPRVSKCVITYKLYKIYINHRYHNHRIIVPRLEVTSL